ncbi:hypothetical protein WN944_021154 [Citrus x changshan-huyou]|uniref:Uncharacterized protein n=1 Tax=Citrus x changshan-huyou TaxID=2935761 RepID=A0AAP0MWB3_9ROSI
MVNKGHSVSRVVLIYEIYSLYHFLFHHQEFTRDIDHVIVFHLFQISVLTLVLDCYPLVDSLTTVG